MRRRREPTRPTCGRSRCALNGVEKSSGKLPLLTLSLFLTRRSQLEKNRLLVSWHRDGTTRFFDLVSSPLAAPDSGQAVADARALAQQSPQLLALPDLLAFEYPAPLPALSILLQPLFAHPSLAALPVSRLLRSDPTRFQIQDVQFASEACEVAVVLATGEVVYFRWSEASEDMEMQARVGGLSLGGVQPADVVDLRSLSNWSASLLRRNSSLHD